MKKVYLDYAATSPLDKKALKAMQPFFTTYFGNPSSLHSWGQKARAKVEIARQSTADFLNAEPEEIIFTSSATEANNLSLKGAVEFWQKNHPGQTPHLIISPLEHHCVLDAAKFLVEKGAEVTWLTVDRRGLVNPDELVSFIQENTVLISLVYGNNEVGTIQSLEKISTKIKSFRKGVYPYLHTDAVQAVQYLNMDVKVLGVDLLSASAHKFSGPKGIGFLYVKKGTKLLSQLHGGSQEFALRAGTENVPGIVGMAKALDIVKEQKIKERERLTGLRDWFIKQVLVGIPNSRLTGHPKMRLPHIASFVFPGAEGEAILLHLDDRGIAASSGSACTSGTLEPSHVLLAMGIEPETAHGSVRFSLGKNTTKDDLKYVLSVLPGIIKKLRKMAPKL